MSNQCVFRVTGVARVLQLCPMTRSLEGLNTAYPLVNLQTTMENHHVSWEKSTNSIVQWLFSSSQVLWVSHVQPKCFEMFIHVGEEITCVYRSNWLVVFRRPSEKWWSSSNGMMTFPTEWKVIKFHGSKPPTSQWFVGYAVSLVTNIAT